MDSLDANTIIVIVLAVFAILGFLKGLVKFFFNLIALAIGGVAGIWGYNNGFTIAKKVVEQPEQWMIIAVGVIAFLGAFSIVRMILRFLSGRGGEDSQVRTMGFGLPGGVFGLIFGGFVTYSMLTGVRYAGTLSELGRLKDYLSGKAEEGDKEPLFAQLKNWIDKSKIGQWHQKIDFINDTARTNLAKLAIVKDNDESLKKITTEKPDDGILEALPLNDEDIRQCIERGDYSALLRHQAILKAKGDQELQKLDVERSVGIKK